MLRRVPLRLFNTVSIWGGGTMGAGIALVTAQSRAVPKVYVVEVSEERCKAARANIQTILTKDYSRKESDGSKVAKKVEDVLSRIAFTTDEKTAAGAAELIVEAVVENIEVKKALWKKLDTLASSKCIFCTNTSSLKVSEQAAVTKRADRFAGLHFFSPVHRMRLVEIVKTDATSPVTLKALQEHTTKIGKTAVTAIDTKGFIVNRLLIPSMLEACRLVERGVASYQDVDTAMKLGAGHPMGPFELADSVGIDVMKLITDDWHKEEPANPLFMPSALIDEKVGAGKLGRKTGEGFYSYKM